MQLEKPDFVDLLHLLAHNFKVRVTNNHIAVNPQCGKGYCWAEKLPSGITVLVSDTCLKDNLIVERPEETSTILPFSLMKRLQMKLIIQ